MKVILHVSLILLLTACSSLKNKKSEVNFEPSSAKEININIDLIATDMAAINSRIRAKLLRKEKYKDLNGLDNNMYLIKVEKYKDPSELEYTDYLKSENIEIVTKGRGLNFAICTRSLKLRFVLCDRADTSILDEISEDLSGDLDQKTEKYFDHK